MTVRLPAPREEDFDSRLHSAAVASRVGVWVGVCFAICFVTGLISHWAYAVHPWLPFPTRPTWGYRVTQGLHVISGTVAVPLLLVKLWTVYPKLFARPPRQVRALVLHGLERVSIAALVGAAIFQLASGLANSAQWYPWAFTFRRTHHAMAWVLIGALVLHVAVKLPVIRAAFGADIDSDAADRVARPDEEPVHRERAGGLTRRQLVRTALLGSGVAALATAGSTVTPLRHVSVLGVRSGDGPLGVPINRSAKAAGVLAQASRPDFALELRHGDVSRTLTRDDLARLRQQEVDLPIACVEGWSTHATWEGVRLRSLLDLVDAPRGSDVRVVSMQTRGAFGVTVLPGRFADDDLTTLALKLSGQTLTLDHGYPCRLIAPDRPGVLQTKWVRRLEVVT